MVNLFAETSGNGGVVLALLWVLYLAVIVLAIASLWKVFEKAGEAGWKAIIPLYNTYTLCRIAGRNGWWMLAFLVPFVNIIVAAVIAIDLAKHFGKDAVFGIVGLWLFSIIGYAILGFGEAQYTGTKHA